MAGVGEGCGEVMGTHSLTSPSTQLWHRAGLHYMGLKVELWPDGQAPDFLNQREALLSSLVPGP